MRHGDKINNLGRTASHRRAMLANMAIALIEHKRITTTLAKAKALRRYVEPLVTKSRSNTTHSRRVVFSYLQNKEAINELFGPIAEKIGDRPGGYMRVIKLGFRRGDGAETAMIEFVDFNETYNPNAGISSVQSLAQHLRANAGFVKGRRDWIWRDTLQILPLGGRLGGGGLAPKEKQNNDDSNDYTLDRADYGGAAQCPLEN